MKDIKKVVESISIIIMTGILAIATVVTSEKQNVQIEETTEGVVAGVASAMNEVDTEVVSVEREIVNVVADTLQDEQTVDVPKEEPKKAKKEKKLTAEQKEWQKYLMADVEEFLYVREKNNKESSIVGKLYKGDRALIKKEGKKWTKIESGSVEGYVLNQYCVMGTEALAYAKKNCEKIATVTGEVLRIRKEQSTDSTIVSALRKGETIPVDTKKKTTDGWVAVKLGTATCYVSAEYVDVTLKTGKAVTLEEEKQREEAKKAAELQSIEKTQQKAERKQVEAVSVSVDEETLLAALIQCEAGGESYECQLAVGAVVLNRIKSGKYPNNMQDVIYQSGQFGPARNGSLARTLRNGANSTPRRAAKEALSGVDNTNGCLYFNNRSCGHSGLTIGAIVFWK